MGAVSNHLRELVMRQVDENGLVVWFDPDLHYREFVQSLDLADTVVVSYEKSFFALRRQIDPYMGGERPPRLVVYVPLAEEETQNALTELAKAGVVLKPGQNPWQRNTRLSVVAKGVFVTAQGPEQAAIVEREVNEGKLTLKDLNLLAEDGGVFAGGVITVIFGTGHPQEVALALLGGEHYDDEIVTKKALPQLAVFLGEAYGIDLATQTNLLELKLAFARHILATELLAGLGEDVPPQLVSVHIATKPAARVACVELACAWRLRRDLRESYAEHSGRVERELGLATIQFTNAQLTRCEGFFLLEQALQAGIEEEVATCAHWTAETYSLTQGLINRRLGGFWSTWPERYPEIQARWQICQAAIEVLWAAERVAGGLKSLAGNTPQLWKRYTDGDAPDEPWCLLDTHQRYLERRCQAFDFDLGERHATLQRVVARARQRYMETAEAIAEAFVHALAGVRFQIPGLLRQTEVYATQVAPALREGKTAYLVVDALRYEMAREVLRSLDEEFEVELVATMGTAPSITEVGMAALLPGAESGAAIVPVAEGKLGFVINNSVLRDRKDRVKWLKAQALGEVSSTLAKVFDLTLDALLQPTKAVKAGIEGADLVYVTSQEIDAICELDNVGLARRVMDDILWQIPRALRILASFGCKTIIVTADHGYLFADELEADMKIDPPGGDTADLHRRVWVGRGGSANSSFCRVALASFGLGGGLEIAVPWGFGAFRVHGGARAYFHGGLSPEEIVIPVGVLKASAARPTLAPEINWTLTLGSKKISTRFVSVQVQGASSGLFAGPPPRVRVEIRAQTGEVPSRAVAATYGFVEATGEVQMRMKEDDERLLDPNTVMLNIIGEPAEKTVDVLLLDAATGRELARLENIEVANFI